MSTKGTHIPDWLAVPFAGITPAPSQEKGQDLFPTGNWRAISPVYRDKMPPCNNACGTNEKIQGYLDLVKRGKYLDAYALIKEDMPFPSVTGRVCYHPCEQACNRGKYDEAISIRAVERFLGDLGQALPKDVVKAGPSNGKKVAVVGSGPAGHSAAYQLARLGYAVTIFEKSPKAGGLNRGGIPDWVLPQNILDREIERLVELGITIKCNPEEMPAVPEDLHDMLEEGVELMHGRAMTAILGNGQVEALQLHPARFTGTINASPIDIDRKTAAQKFAVDNVIIAVGQHASLA